jgi:lipopolysaccharide transport system ATP-binding protein
MSQPVITVEHLSKRYFIGHKSARPARESTFRDMIVREISSLARSASDLVRGRQIASGDEVEEFWALDDVNFQVNQGEVLGIIGQNGAGKSTLLKILSRITEPTKGRITISGRVASLLEVGTGFHQELTGRENIFLNGAILGMRRTEIRRKFDEIVAFSEVERFLDTPVKRYSSGMYVRLAFAVAAHLEPEILIVDEVLAVGDAEFQRKCLGKIGDVAAGGRTVLFVSHNMNVVSKLCKAVLVLSRGRAEGVSSDVSDSISRYLNPVGLQEMPFWENANKRILTEFITAFRFFAKQNDTDRKLSEFRNDSPISIFVGGVVHRRHSALTAGIAVYAADGTLLFWSYTTDTDQPLWANLDQGPFLLTCEIPPHLLNEGTYFVEFIASIHHQTWLLKPGANVPRFQFSIRDGLSDSPIWSERRPGLLAPVLKWSRVVETPSLSEVL